MKKLLHRAALAALFYCASVPAFGQGTINLHAFGIGKGPGVQGVTSLLCASAQLAVGQASADPICQTLSGDVTMDATGATTIGAGKVTNAKLGPDVFSTAHSWTALQTFSNGVSIASAFTATGLVKYADLATAALATQPNYFAGAANVIVPASVIYNGETTTTFGATTSFDFSTFINTRVTLTANITTMNVSNVMAGKAGHIVFKQSGAGSFTTVFNSVFKFAGGTAPALTTGSATAEDVLFYDCTSATECYASLNKDMR
jgi:hypothetical protein